MKAKKENDGKFPSKKERLAMAAKQGLSELVVYLALCKKLNRKPAPSAVRRQRRA